MKTKDERKADLKKEYSSEMDRIRKKYEKQMLYVNILIWTAKITIYASTIYVIYFAIRLIFELLNH